MRRLLVLAFAAGCGPRAAPAPSVSAPARSAELTSAFAQVETWIGDWKGPDASEHWRAASGALYGVWFHGDQFVVKIVDDGEGEKADGVLRYITVDNGQSSVETRELPPGFSHAREYKAATVERAPEIAEADRAFAADVAARGADGWYAAFDPHGGMLRHGKRVEGDAIREAMEPLFSAGTLAWAPIADGKVGTLGFTVGKATFTGKDPSNSGASTYITIWRKQPDGAWKVLFDIGRQVN